MQNDYDKLSIAQSQLNIAKEQLEEALTTVDNYKKEQENYYGYDPNETIDADLKYWHRYVFERPD
jgi:hypothetical protein